MTPLHSRGCNVIILIKCLLQCVNTQHNQDISIIQNQADKETSDAWYTYGSIFVTFYNTKCYKVQFCMNRSSTVHLLAVTKKLCRQMRYVIVVVVERWYCGEIRIRVNCQSVHQDKLRRSGQLCRGDRYWRFHLNYIFPFPYCCWITKDIRLCVFKLSR